MLSFINKLLGNINLIGWAIVVIGAFAIAPRIGWHGYLVSAVALMVAILWARFIYLTSPKQTHEKHRTDKLVGTRRSPRL
jgi:membrane protein implicated in regulation of membrane protease activity